MTDFTAHFRFPIPDFNQEPWHAELIAALRAVDTTLYDAVLIQGVGNWANSTTYAVGAIVIDAATGLMWTCAAANTSSAAPTTFAQERIAHPTYWSATANIPQQRGTWTTATSYIPGDFVIDTNRYAVCLVPHVSGVFNTDLAAAKWSVLIDVSGLGLGINTGAEDTIASAATTDIGSKTATRILVTGVVTITGFGVVANTFKILRFGGVLTLTNSVNIVLLGGVDRVTAANDVMWVTSDATGKWRELMYNRASGVPLAVPDATDTVKGLIELATQGEVNTGTDTVRAIVPSTLKNRLDNLTDSILGTVRGGVGDTLDTLGEIATAIGFLAPKANPTFTGTVDLGTAATVSTPAANDDDVSVPTTAFVNDAAKWTLQAFFSGSGNWSRPAGCKKIAVLYIGDGGGGAATITNNGSNGSGTTFNSIEAKGGSGGLVGGASKGGGGPGGVSGAGAATLRFAGSDGSPGGNGGSGLFGGAGRGGIINVAGAAGKANTGAGGGGGGSNGGNIEGGGGGQGELVLLVIDNPAASYAFTIGPGGTAGAAGGRAGGDGGSGFILVIEYYFVP